MLFLRTFGGLALESRGGEIGGAGSQRSRLALLAVLAAVGQRGISRDLLLTLFWPESDTDSARNALKQSLHVLRRDLGEPQLFLGSTALRLNPAAIESDVALFQRAFAAEQMEQAAALYEGVFLQGFSLAKAEFDHWVDEERARIRARYRLALKNLTGDAERREDYPGAVRWWRTLVADDGLSAAATRGLMQALVKAGDSAAALQHAREYEALVRVELEAPPDPSVVRLAAQIRKGMPSVGTEALELPAAGPSEPFSPPLTPTSTRQRWRLVGAIAIAALTIGTIAIRVFGERQRVALAERSDPLFRHWASNANLPRTWDSYQELRAGIQAFVAGDSSSRNHFRRAATLDSSSVTPLVWEAFAAQQFGSRFPRAEIAALDSSRRQFGAWDRAMADFLSARARNEASLAHEAGHRILKVAPGSEWAVLVAALVLNHGHSSEAIELLEQLDPDSGWIRGWKDYWITLDRAYHFQRDYEGELKAADRALTYDPDSRLFLQFKLKALAGLGRVAEVEQVCDRAMTIKPQAGYWWAMQPCAQAIAELRAHGQRGASWALTERFLDTRERTVIATAAERVIERAGMYEQAGNWERENRALEKMPAADRSSLDFFWARMIGEASVGDRGGLGVTRREFEEAHPADGPLELPRDVEDAQIAALLGNRVEATSRLAKALREGWSGIAIIHLFAPFDRLAGYPPYDVLITPVEDSAHLDWLRQSNAKRKRS